MHNLFYRFQFKCPGKECGAEIVLDDVFRKLVIGLLVFWLYWLNTVFYVLLGKRKDGVQLDTMCQSQLQNILCKSYILHFKSPGSVDPKAHSTLLCSK